MEWIDVKNELPPENEKVLVTDGIEIETGYRFFIGKQEYFLPSYREEMGEITHWTSLPKPPGEK